MDTSPQKHENGTETTIMKSLCIHHGIGIFGCTSFIYTSEIRFPIIGCFQRNSPDKSFQSQMFCLTFQFTTIQLILGKTNNIMQFVGHGVVGCDMLVTFYVFQQSVINKSLQHLSIIPMTLTF